MLCHRATSCGQATFGEENVRLMKGTLFVLPVPHAQFVDSVYFAQHSSNDASKKFEITDQGVTLIQKEKADRSYFCSASVEIENSIHPP